MGFDAAKDVEELAYNFNPHADLAGVIPEPSTKQVAKYRSSIVKVMADAGIDPDDDSKFTFAQMDELMKKSSAVEDGILFATADLTGITPAVIRALPYRISAAFAGWIMGVFFDPEA